MILLLNFVNDFLYDFSFTLNHTVLLDPYIYTNEIKYMYH